MWDDGERGSKLLKRSLVESIRIIPRLKELTILTKNFLLWVNLSFQKAIGEKSDLGFDMLCSKEIPFVV